MNNKELFYFTGKCLTLDEHPELREEILKKINSESIDWQKFIGLCNNHLILPLIYIKFQSNNLLTHLPVEVSEFLKEIHQLNFSKNKLILKQLEEVTELLNQNGIAPTFLKGTANLLDELYKDLGERMIGDIDLLVSKKEYLRAAGILENAGYLTAGIIYFDLERLKHYPRLFKADVPLHIEVHRLVVAERDSKYFNSEIINNEKKAINNHTNSFVLSDRHKVIHIFIHGQLGHQGHAYGIVPFRDLYDLYQLSKRVDVASTIGQIEQKRKAISYFVFAGKALGLPGLFYPHETFTSRLFCLKHDLNQSSRVFYVTHRSLRYVYERIFIGISRQIIESFYSRNMRKSIINRLSDRKWYKANFDSYFSFFTGKIK